MTWCSLVDIGSRCALGFLNLYLLDGQIFRLQIIYPHLNRTWNNSNCDWLFYVHLLQCNWVVFGQIRLQTGLEAMRDYSVQQLLCLTCLISCKCSFSQYLCKRILKKNHKKQTDTLFDHLNAKRFIKQFDIYIVWAQ